MTLREAIRDLRSFDSSDTLFVATGQRLTSEIQVVVARMSEDDSLPDVATGYEVFLEVWHVQEIIQGKSDLAGLTAPPSLEQRLAFLLHYAAHDA